MSTRTCCQSLHGQPHRNYCEKPDSDTTFGSIVPRTTGVRLDEPKPDDYCYGHQRRYPCYDCYPKTGRATLGAVVTRDIMAEEKVVLPGGATRTKQAYRFDLVPSEAERRQALRYALGAAKHGENNWRNGNWEFIVQCIGHLKAHVATMVIDGGNAKDDNLGAILWNAASLCWFETHKPEEFAKALRYLQEGTNDQR